MPAMGKHKDDEVKCCGIAVARPFPGDYETTFAMQGGRRREFIKAAHISGTKFLCHPGGPPIVNGLVQIDAKEPGRSLRGNPSVPEYLWGDPEGRSGLRR